MRKGLTRVALVVMGPVIALALTGCSTTVPVGDNNCVATADSAIWIEGSVIADGHVTCVTAPPQIDLQVQLETNINGRWVELARANDTNYFQSWNTVNAVQTNPPPHGVQYWTVVWATVSYNANSHHTVQVFSPEYIS